LEFFFFLNDYSGMKKCVLVFVLVLFFTGLLNAQKSKQEIRVIADGKKDSIILRWAPSTPLLWQMGNRYGYTIERFTIKIEGKLVTDGNKKGKMLTSTPLKPAAKEYFDSLGIEDERAVIVKEAIYGDEFKLEAGAGGTGGILNKSMELDNRFGFALLICDLSPKSANAAGLYFVDRDVKPNYRYIYRIKLGQAIPNFTYGQGVILLDGGDNFQLNLINDLSAKFSDRNVLLKWPVFLNNGVYSAYQIEKSEDGQSFQKISDQPLINTSEKNNPEYAYYVDSLNDNTSKYFYRVRGFSPFGELGPSSNVVSGQGKEEIPVLTIIDSSKVINNKKVGISWHLDNPQSRKVKGYYVMRSSKEEGPYTDLNEKLLGNSVLTFTDASPRRSNYYRIKTILEDDDISISYPYLALLVDSMPPASPIGITGSIDSLGVVKLKWSQSKEEDLYGYRVFRSNDLGEEFVEITPAILAKPFFRDTVTINTLTSKVFYKVIAIDKNFNTSDYSAAFELRRPDTIAPKPPVFSQIRRVDTTIKINWVSSNSQDLRKHILYRIDKASNKKEKLFEWPAMQSQNQFIDRNGLSYGSTYYYNLEAYDSASNKSSVVSGEIFFETGIRKSIVDIKAKADRENRKIILNWKYGEQEVSKMIIYRSKQGEPLVIHETLNGNPQQYEDKELFINNTYAYKVQAIFKGGAKSPLSAELIVKY
jgi:fibronectin type 3 domain-containing protein